MTVKRLSSSRALTPVHVQIEVTWRCNWRCVHCYQDSHKEETFSTEKLLELVDEFSAAGVMHIIVTGGEPLVRKDLFDFLTRIRERNMTCTLYSNGHNISSEIAEKLSDLVASVELSILAGEADVHDHLSSVKGSFNRVNVAARELRARDVCVIIKTPILKPAISTLKEIELFALEIGADWNADPEISKSYFGADYPIAHQLNRRELEKFFLDFPQFNPATGYTSDPGVFQGMCLAGRQYCFIDVFGNVYPCLNFKSASDANEHLGKQPSARMGNVFETSFKQIWDNSIIGQKIRQSNRSYFESCSNCQGKCSPCMALNFEETGNIFSPAPSVCLRTQIGGTSSEKMLLTTRD